GPYLAMPGRMLTLDATASFDRESPQQSLAFEWDLNYDASGFTVDATGMQPRVRIDALSAARTIALRVTDPSGRSTIATSLLQPASSVVARRLFYNDSAFDGYDALATADDDPAIASDKQALLPGQTATFANYS